MLNMLVQGVTNDLGFKSEKTALKFFVCLRMFQGADLPCTAMNAGISIEEVMVYLNEINPAYVRSVKSKLITKGIPEAMIQDYINKKGRF